MRTLLATLLLLSTALAALPAPAQAQPEATGLAPLLEDPAGDLKVLVAGEPVQQGGAATSAFTALDLRALAVGEDPGGFVFQIRMTDLGEDAARPDYGSAVVRFTFDGCRFYVTMYRASDNAAYFASVYRAQAEGPFSLVRGVPAERDLSTDLIWSRVDRFDLACGEGNVPGRGDVIGGVSVDTTSFATGSGVTRVGDVMPESGTGSYTVLYGGGEAHGAALSTPQPFRSSNGASTTYLFDVTAAHAGTEDARFRVSVENVPEGWNVTLPGDLVEVRAGLPVVFPVYVSTVFRHQHGTVDAFQLHLHEADGERWATLDLGVHFVAVPQPAGHHPRLFLHSSDWASTAETVNAPLGGTGGYLTMNTLDEDPADTRKPSLGRSQVAGLSTGVAPEALGVARYQWSACLEPGLDLGLDFDLATQGSIEVPISATRPLSGATLTGRLLHVGPGEPMQYCFPYYYQERQQTVVAEFDFGSKDIGANGAATYAAAVQARPEADLIAAQPGSALVLELTLEAAGVPIGGVAGAYLQPGAWMQLPLLEFEDAVRVQVPERPEPVVGFVQSEDAGREAPTVPVPLAAAALLAVALLRRRA